MRSIGKILAVLLFAACAKEESLALPETHTFADGEGLVSASAAICADRGILQERGVVRIRRWLAAEGNGELSTPVRWRENQDGRITVIVHPGETFAVPQDLCAPLRSPLRKAFMLLLATALIIAGLLEVRRQELEMDRNRGASPTADLDPEGKCT